MTTTPEHTLNPEQVSAIEAMEAFCKADFDDLKEPFYLLKGPAGTGKTYCIKHLIPKLRGRLVFTAPTNKATKVLRESVTSDDYSPECRTIYSLLGLRLEPSGEVKELVSPDDPLDLTQFAAVIVDEASMVNSLVFQHIKAAAYSQRIRFIFMGDAAQLPPVKEKEAVVMGLPLQSELTKVERHDNAILDLVTRIRKVQSHPAPSIKLESNNDGKEGVVVSGPKFLPKIQECAVKTDYFQTGEAKIIAWRNVTVGTYNTAVRSYLFNEAAETFWLPTDRLCVLAPVKGGEKGKMIATTDDEGIVNSVEVVYHPAYSQFKCWKLQVTLDTGGSITLLALHPTSQTLWDQRKTMLAEEAKAAPRRWKMFWDFVDSFHVVRHGYAITAHRAQGSTYQVAFVDWRDILLNRNRLEAFQCLYVACSRPRERLFLN